MRKICESIIVMAVLLFFTIMILSNSNVVLDAVSFAIEIWKTSVFPSLFPFFVVSTFLINYGFVELSSEVFKNVMWYLFHMNGNAAFAFIMSIISGFPSSAKYTRELYLNGKINKKEATKLLMFSHFSNPLFILGTVSVLFLNNKEVGILILSSHYICNIIIGILLRNYAPSVKDLEKISLKNAILKMHEKRINSNKTFGQIMSKAISDSIETLLLVLGTITVFLTITSIINNILHEPPYYQAIINGIIEMTQGLKYVGMLTIPLKLKTILATMILSFGGLSVHIQIISILSDTDLPYLPFFLARIFHAILSGVLVYFSFDIFTLLL